MMFVVKTLQQLELQTPTREMKIAHLLVHAANFAHKAIVATVLGYFSYSTRSSSQVIMICALQCVMLLYLVWSRPYRHTSIFATEVCCHLFELLVFVCSIVVLFVEPLQSSLTHHVLENTMIGEWPFLGFRHHDTSRLISISFDRFVCCNYVHYCSS
jgi:hypothetical protein